MQTKTLEDWAGDLLGYAYKGNFTEFKEILNDTEEVTAQTFVLLHEILDEVLTYKVFSNEQEQLVNSCCRCARELLTIGLEKACRFFRYRYYIVKDGFHKGIKSSGAVNDLCNFIINREKDKVLELFYVLRDGNIGNLQVFWIEFWFKSMKPGMDRSMMRKQCKSALRGIK